jgi:hypothetical protein
MVWYGIAVNGLHVNVMLQIKCMESAAALTPMMQSRSQLGQQSMGMGSQGYSCCNCM